MCAVKTTLSIGVVGAGPGGLAFARRAQLDGHHVRVFERSSELKNRGGSMQLTQGVRCVEEHLDLAEQLQAFGVPPTTLAVRLSGVEDPILHDLGNGRRRRRVMRMDLVSMLAKSLKPGTVVFNKELDSLMAADDKGSVTCRFKDGTDSEHDLVVGADGINSRVRSLLFDVPDVPAKQFTGFRILTMLDKERNREKSGLSDGVTCVRLALDKKAYVLETRTRCADGSCCDTVAVVFKTGEKETDAWDHDMAVEGLRNKLKEFATNDDDYLFDMLGSAKIAWDWGVYQHAPCESWSALGGRVCLLGDACHASAPFLAQGCNMALQDAVCLARYLSMMPVPEATKAYEERRKPICEKIVECSKNTAEAWISAASCEERTESAKRQCQFIQSFQDADLVI